MQADNVLLYACRQMVKCKPAFAELLLPMAFEDLALHYDYKTDLDAAKEASCSMSEAISSCLMPHCAAHPKAMRLLLRCLNHLRGLYLDARSLTRPSSTQSTSSTPVLTAVQAQTWNTVFWVNLDYLKLAEAALKCRAYFSALLYCETWCEHVGDWRLVYPLPGSVGGARRAELDSLLLDIYSNIDEPDGLYAVSRSNVVAAFNGNGG